MGIGRTRAAVPAMLASTAAMAAVVVCGCGSSPKPLTRAELTSKANAVCRSVGARVESASRGANGSQQAIARLAPRLAGFEQRALAELGKLIPPAELEADWKLFVADAGILAEDVAKLGEYAASNRLKTANGLIDSTNRILNQMKAISKRDGLTDCTRLA